MQRIQPTENEYSWPRHAVQNLELRKRDLVIRIADWTRNNDACSYDVEVYIGGVYDWNESASCDVSIYGTKTAAKLAAIQIAQEKIAKLL